ncbi:unnamed protein product [Paramecium octaurelia]|uniref:Uncharacterized protein n=1 Tax=Paramecium octaurelia TaxID=43137 RepID=A0A8S1SK87_PAROT|nr:unnamed protein product [Paramecium octaurelia]
MFKLYFQNPKYQYSFKLFNEFNFRDQIAMKFVNFHQEKLKIALNQTNINIAGFQIINVKLPTYEKVQKLIKRIFHIEESKLNKESSIQFVYILDQTMVYFFLQNQIPKRLIKYLFQETKKLINQ